LRSDRLIAPMITTELSAALCPYSMAVEGGPLFTPRERAR
jgi:hypothetical protein